MIITSYPPRECGIATYSQDLVKSINNKFSTSFSIKICALGADKVNYNYPKEVEFILDTSVELEYERTAESINKDTNIQIVLIQHEFGFFSKQKQAFIKFLSQLSKPIVIVFHTVLPNPNIKLKSEINKIVEICQSIIVMTNTSANVLIKDLPSTKR